MREGFCGCRLVAHVPQRSIQEEGDEGLEKRPFHHLLLDDRDVFEGWGRTLEDGAHILIAEEMVSNKGHRVDVGRLKQDTVIGVGLFASTTFSAITGLSSHVRIYE